MGADGQEQPESSSRSKRSFFRSSIVWKLTLFVGVLVTLNCGVLIGVAYIATSEILRNQIDERLSTVASDRQEMLAYTLKQQEERATQLAKRVRIHHLFAQRAEGAISPDRFRAETETILSAVRGPTRPVFWRSGSRIEAGQVRCLEWPRGAGCRLFPAETGPSERPDGSLVVPPRRVGSAFGFVFSSVVRGPDGRASGTVLLLSDFGPIAAFLMDPNGLEETGEVLVGVAEGETIRLILPSRRVSPVSEVAASQFPAMSDAIAGKFGCMRTIDYHGKDVLAAYRPVGFGFSGWGLGRQDRLRRGVPAGRPPALVVAGVGRSGPGAGAGSLQRDRAAVRTTDPPVGQDLFGGRGRRSERPQRGHRVGRDRRARARRSTG